MKNIIKLPICFFSIYCENKCIQVNTNKITISQFLIRIYNMYTKFTEKIHTLIIAFIL